MKFLNWKTHMHDLASKLNRANEVLAKVRHFVNSEILKSHLLCCNPFSFEVCMHSLGTYKISSTKSIYSPKKALRIMNFAPFNTQNTLLFKNCNILKFADIINVESCIFINNCFNKDFFSIFNKNVKLVSTTHSYNVKSARNGLLFAPSYNTVRFGRKSIVHSTTLTWNYLQYKLNEYSFLCLKLKSLKILSVKFFTSSITAKLKFNEPVVMMIIYYEYEIVYIYTYIHVYI